ncbi:unnamed protein product, partial [Symbiodinium sp. KB8]
EHLHRDAYQRRPGARGQRSGLSCGPLLEKAIHGCCGGHGSPRPSDPALPARRSSTQPFADQGVKSGAEGDDPTAQHRRAPGETGLP